MIKIILAFLFIHLSYAAEKPEMHAKFMFAPEETIVKGQIVKVGSDKMKGVYSSPTWQEWWALEEFMRSKKCEMFDFVHYPNEYQDLYRACFFNTFILSEFVNSRGKFSLSFIKKRFDESLSALMFVSNFFNLYYKKLYNEALNKSGNSEAVDNPLGVSKKVFDCYNHRLAKSTREYLLIYNKMALAWVDFFIRYGYAINLSQDRNSGIVRYGFGANDRFFFHKIIDKDKDVSKVYIMKTPDVHFFYYSTPCCLRYIHAFATYEDNVSKRGHISVLRSHNMLNVQKMFNGASGHYKTEYGIRLIRRAEDQIYPSFTQNLFVQFPLTNSLGHLLPQCPSLDHGFIFELMRKRDSFVCPLVDTNNLSSMDLAAISINVAYSLLQQESKKFQTSKYPPMQYISFETLAVNRDVDEHNSNRDNSFSRFDAVFFDKRINPLESKKYEKILKMRENFIDEYVSYLDKLDMPKEKKTPIASFFYKLFADHSKHTSRVIEELGEKQRYFLETSNLITVIIKTLPVAYFTKIPTVKRSRYGSTDLQSEDILPSFYNGTEFQSYFEENSFVPYFVYLLDKFAKNLSSLSHM